MNIEEFKKKKETLAAEMREHGKAALLDGFKALFAESPELQAVRWDQYTPHFNDGDACVFSVNEFNFKIDGLDPEGGDYEDGFHNYVGDYGLSAEEREAIKPARAVFNRIKDLAKALQDNSLEDVYLIAFGDHREVTISRGETELVVETEEYEHD